MITAEAVAIVAGLTIRDERRRENSAAFSLWPVLRKVEGEHRVFSA
jgi:hypothetical protein